MGPRLAFCLQKEPHRAVDLVGGRGTRKREGKVVLEGKQERKCPLWLAPEVPAQPPALILVGCMWTCGGLECPLRKGSPEIHQKGVEWERDTQGDAENTPRERNSWREGASELSRQRDMGRAKSQPGKQSRGLRDH